MAERSRPADKPDWLAKIHVEQVFRLIDGILPFEACLYHQVLPIALEGSRLRLGMVNLDDTAALEYVRRMFAYMNCSLTPEPIPSEMHHAALTAYLNYTGSKSSNPVPKSLKPAAPETPAPEPQPAHHDRLILDRNTAPTLLVDNPLELVSPEPAPKVREQLAVAEEFSKEPSTPEQENLEGNALPVLEVNAQHSSDNLAVLATLPVDQLLQELLGRILASGIGRLYFEQQSNQGRILWSQDGVLQSILESVPTETIQSLILELKRLTRLPMAPVQKPKQVEIERLYQTQRVLLRLRIMPGTHGEEATLQILRGAALKFYQRQQLASLSRDALSIGQELQRKITELRTRTRFYPMLTPEQLSILPQLREVLHSVDQQLEALRSLQTDASDKDEQSD